MIKSHKIGNSEVFLQDCVEGMKGYEDGYFDLACVDPVFGEMVTKGGYMSNSSSSMAKNKKYNNNLWKQEKTNAEYFIELFRISKNQIVWGGNYFTEEINKNSSCWIVWNKKNGENVFADCEIAWTSFKTAVRMFEFRWQGMLQENMKDKEIRIHPTQKPVALYDFIYKNYATEGMKILDTHLGSQSNRISAEKNKMIFTAFETDEDYFNQGNKRFEDFKKQLTIF